MQINSKPEAVGNGNRRHRAKLSKMSRACTCLSIERDSEPLLGIEKIFAPLIVAASEQTHEVAAGMQTERAGRTQQLHTGFLGRAAAFPVVAGMTAGDQIFPGRLAGAGGGYDMIERHFPGRKRFVAV